ncbi:MAG: molybdopterin-dependent oxidoreductase, partial [Desulfohalobiaceae bacterium]|nr:molybdopterin-dependent oxidoreductase [Desulfohalobiaceae bacterium]
RRVIRAKERGARLIVADPRRIHLSRYADVHLRHRLGSDVALLNGLMRIILENNWQDTDYIRERTEGFDQLHQVLKQYPPDKVARITGVPEHDLYAAAEIYAGNSPASLLYAMGITQHTTGVDNVKSCCNLAMLCGNVGIEGGGVNPLRGQNNVQGACDMGGLPNVFSGYQPVNDPEVHERFCRAWKTDLPEKPGLTITDMVQAMLDGKLKGLYVIGENPKLSDPNLNHFHQALGNLDFLVVQDLFLSETAQLADVVLAASSVAEKEGTYTNSERRCMRTFKAIEPIGESLPDWEILCRLSQALGYPMDYASPQEVFEEIAALTPKSYGGMSYERLGINGLQWPCPAPDHPGTPYLHGHTFSRGKGKFHAVDFREPAEMPDETYPFFLTTGRMFAHFHTGTMTRVSKDLDQEESTGYVEINPEDAQRLEAADKDILILANSRGEMEVPARVTETVPPGTLFLPIHFGENPTNILTSNACDPLCKIPEFKVAAVHCKKLQN